MEIKGFLKQKVGSRTGMSQQTGNQWQTDEWLLVIPGMYEKTIKLDVRGIDRCKQWDEFFNGMPDRNAYVTVSIDINAHENGGRWYNNIEAWNIAIATI